MLMCDYLMKPDDIRLLTVEPVVYLSQQPVVLPQGAVNLLDFF